MCSAHQPHPQPTWTSIQKVCNLYLMIEHGKILSSFSYSALILMSLMSLLLLTHHCWCLRYSPNVASLSGLCGRPSSCTIGCHDFFPLKFLQGNAFWNIESRFGRPLLPSTIIPSQKAKTKQKKHFHVLFLHHKCLRANVKCEQLKM